jgi:peroxiredoxin
MQPRRPTHLALNILSKCAITLAGLVAYTATTPAIAQSDASYKLIPAEARKPAPDFLLTDLDGKKLTLAQYRGRVVLLDFWAVDCGGCKIEIPWYVAFDKSYRAQGLQLVGIDMYGESPAVVKPFMAKSGMNYPVAIGNDAIGTQFHVDEMPLTLLIDRRGCVAISHAGIIDRTQFEQAIQQLLR